MVNSRPYLIKTISQYHQILGIAKPEHPLISVINLNSFEPVPLDKPISVVFDFYSISLKRNVDFKLKYGQESYDFDEGVMAFSSPNQVFGIEANKGKGETSEQSGWMLFIHPDFLWSTPLAKTIRQYEYFNYSVHEALHLSDKEETMIINIMKSIQQEYKSNIDKFSQSVIIAQIELLLTYGERFYQRQFITRKISNHKVLETLEEVLNKYFSSKQIIEQGMPSVNYLADKLNVSPSYLSSLLKVHTGMNTQQHIHNKLIEKAKEKLSTTNLSVSEIAYELGFEHPQSFSKLFKGKTNLSPLEFRASFN